MMPNEDTVDNIRQEFFKELSLINFFLYGGILVITFVAFSRLFIDTYYFIRMGWTIFTAHRSKSHLLDEQRISVIVLPTDLDHCFHMNNSRYNREVDFGRTYLLLKSRWLVYTHNQGWKVGLAASTLRFRKSLNLFETAWLKSKVAYWNDRSIYVEHVFVRKSDDFICAVGYSKYTVAGATMKEVMVGYGFTGECPEPSSELSAWIEFNNLSSDKLKPKSS